MTNHSGQNLMAIHRRMERERMAHGRKLAGTIAQQENIIRFQSNIVSAILHKLGSVTLTKVEIESVPEGVTPESKEIEGTENVVFSVDYPEPESESEPEPTKETDDASSPGT